MRKIAGLVDEIGGDEPAAELEVTLEAEPVPTGRLTEAGALRIGGHDGCNGFGGG